MQEVNEAYNILKDPRKRAKYDRERASAAPARPDIQRPAARSRRHKGLTPPQMAGTLTAIAATFVAIVGLLFMWRRQNQQTPEIISYETLVYEAQEVETFPTLEEPGRETLEVEIPLPSAWALPMEEIINILYEDGILQSTTGRYYQLPGFEQDWADPASYRWWRTGYPLENFVIRSLLEWETAIYDADLARSGCGFVYGEDSGDHVYTYLALDGTVRTTRVSDGRRRTFQSFHYGELQLPEGNATVVLVVEDSWITFYINEEFAVRLNLDSQPAGNLAYAISTGTDQGFGTRCSMQNIELWELTN